MIPVLQVGLGPLGQRVVEDLHARALGRVVAAVDPHPDLSGKRLSDVVHGCPPSAADVKVCSALEEVEDWGSIRCAIVTTSSDLELCMDTFRGLLAHAMPVVSTCEELAWPWLRHPILAQELHELAVKHSGRILGTGVNPGFLMDALPVVASTACRSVARVRVERVQDAFHRRLPFQAKIGTGASVAEFEARVKEGSLRHVGLGESLHFLAHYLGMTVERWNETIDPVLAEEDVESGLGTVRAGEARGVLQKATGWVEGEPCIELVFRAAVGEPESYDRIAIDGEPPLDVVVRGGIHGDVATSAIVLNTVRPLLLAEPGLHTMGSIPLQGCTAPDDFTAP